MTLRTIVKETVYAVAAASGVPRLAGAHRGGGLIALTYHSVGPAVEHPYLNRMPPDRFRAQVRYLKANYDVVAISDGLESLTSDGAGARRRRPMAAITVDDGYADNFQHIFPIAREEGVPVTIFLATDYLDSGRLPWPTRISALLHFATALHCPMPGGVSGRTSLPIGTRAEKSAAAGALRQVLSQLDQADREEAIDAISRALVPRDMQTLPPLTWDQVREMQAAGVVFGSHTRFHAWLDRVSDAELYHELSAAKARIEAETARACHALAYPNGNHDARVRAAAARAGYRHALTQDRGINAEGFDPLALGRIEVPFNERLGTFICRAAGFVV